MFEAEPPPVVELPKLNGKLPRPKPQTSTERGRAFRQRKREAQTFVPEQQTTNIPRQSAITFATFTAALALATCSAYFSIVGLTAIFAGSYWPVVAMGVALEIGKLSAVAWLGRFARDGSRSLVASLVALVAVLMGLNSIGVYGYLSRAHVEHALAGDLAVAGRAADVEARLAVQSGVLADLDRRIAQIDSAVEESTRRGRSVSAMNLAGQQRHNRADLVAARQQEAKTLAALQVEKAAIDGERKSVEADNGPVRYLAKLIGAKDTLVMRWFILAVALLLDPAAVVLLLAATAHSRAGNRPSGGLI
jgi:hypothetical protein